MSTVDGGEALRIVIAAFASFAVVVWTIPFVRRIALANEITDHPGDDRWHRTPTPYLGGAALVAGAISAAAVLPTWEAEAAPLILGAVVLAVVGLVDDVRTIAPLRRVVFESGVAATVFFAGARVEIFNTVIDFVLTVGWFVVVTNAFNLLDNMDGGMASIAAVVAAAIATVALSGGQVMIGGLAIVTGTACLGFLLYNWHPAQILMGDAGSLFLGFMLAALALKLRPDVPRPVSVIGLVLLLSPALFDTSLVVVSRLRAGRSIFIGGTDHTSHRLMRLGLGQRATAAVLAVAAAALSGCGVLVSVQIVNPVVGAMAIAIPCAMVGIALLRMPVYTIPAHRPRVDLR